ncbi:hypothetical protein M9434_003384 [Picochlorum sp. BPE23]|nr:hypothetical protein M9434_003384 [Picochlorum sp. BPE23]
MSLRWHSGGKKQRTIYQVGRYIYGRTYNFAGSLLSAQKHNFRTLLRTSFLAILVLYVFYHVVSVGQRDPERAAETDSLLSVYVLLYKRPEGARALLQDLSTADYNGHKIPLHVMVEHDPNISVENREVVTIARKFRWKHGPSSVHTASKKRGLAQTWLSLGKTCPAGSLLAVFEDDVRLSPYWFNWTKDVHQRYLASSQRVRSEIASNIIGISLTPIRVKEMRYPYEPWDSTRKVNLSHSVFLHNLPSSWGPVLVCNEWRNFLPYAMYRRNKAFLPDEKADPIAGAYLGDPNFNLPDCFSNTWSQSWKRLLIEYCFMLGKTTIYPNILGQAGLASNLHLPGTHVSNRRKTRATLDYRTSRLILDDSIFSNGFPPVDDLKVFDLHSDKGSHAILRQQGSVLKQGLLQLGSIYLKGIELLHSPSALPEFPRKDWYFVCPEGTIYRQLARQVLLLYSIWKKGQGLLLSHMRVFVPGYGYQYIPFSEVVDVPHKIGYTHVKIATMANLAESRPSWLFSDLGNASLDACRSYYRIWSTPGDETKTIPVASITHVQQQSNISRWVGFSPLLVDASQTASAATQEKTMHLLRPNFRTELYINETMQKKKFTNSESRVCIDMSHCSNTKGCKERIHAAFLSAATEIVDQTLTEAIIIIPTDKASSVEFVDYIKDDILMHDTLHILSSAHIQEHLEKRAPLQSQGLLRATSSFIQFSLCASSKVLILREHGDVWHLLKITVGTLDTPPRSQHSTTRIVRFW